MLFVWKEISSFLCTLFFLINTILVVSTKKIMHCIKEASMSMVNLVDSLGLGLDHFSQGPFV